MTPPTPPSDTLDAGTEWAGTESPGTVVQPCPLERWSLEVVVVSEDRDWPADRIRVTLTGAPANRAQVAGMSSRTSDKCLFDGKESSHYVVGAAVTKWELLSTVTVDLERGQDKKVTLRIRKPRTWVAVKMVDMEDRPVSGLRYRIQLPDGSTQEGTLGADGVAKYEDIEGGSCDVSFPDLDKAAWEPA